jgi:hypothetical protein
MVLSSQKKEIMVLRLHACYILALQNLFSRSFYVCVQPKIVSSSKGEM